MNNHFVSTIAFSITQQMIARILIYVLYFNCFKEKKIVFHQICLHVRTLLYSFKGPLYKNVAVIAIKIGPDILFFLFLPKQAFRVYYWSSNSAIEIVHEHIAKFCCIFNRMHLGIGNELFAQAS